MATTNTNGTTPENVTPTPDGLYVLDEAGLAELTKEIFKNVNERIEERITTLICPHSDDDHVPSAKTVYEALGEFTQIKYLTITSGNIEEANITPDNNTIYMVRKSTSDVQATMYAWIEGLGFINCGSGAVAEIDNVTINAIPNDVISRIVSESYEETDPQLEDATDDEHLDDRYNP